MVKIRKIKDYRELSDFKPGTKPKMEQLDKTLSIEYKSRVSKGKDWNEIVAVVQDLPPLPHVATRALSLIEDPNINANQLTSILQKDAALAARVLKIANSAMYSAQRTITTLTQAIMVIGFKTLKGLILAASLKQINRKSDKTEKLIWENSMCTAIIAHTLCHHLRKPYADELFLAGLLHDLGKIVLALQLPKDYQLVVEKICPGKQFFEIEQEVLGFAHPLLGALVAKKWNFSEDTCQILLHHHDPLEPSLNDPLYLKIALIQLSNAISHNLGYGNLEGYYNFSIELPILFDKIGIGKEDIEKLLERIKTNISEQAGAFL